MYWIPSPVIKLVTSWTLDCFFFFSIFFSFSRWMSRSCLKKRSWPLLSSYFFRKNEENKKKKLRKVNFEKTWSKKRKRTIKMFVWKKFCLYKETLVEDLECLLKVTEKEAEKFRLCENWTWMMLILHCFSSLAFVCHVYLNERSKNDVTLQEE